MESSVLLALAVLVILGFWTLFSANLGRRAARWGRRKFLRAALVAAALLATAAVLVQSG